MKMTSIAIGMFIMALGGCGVPSEQATEPAAETGQNDEALTDGSRMPACGWNMTYYEWKCTLKGWDQVVVGASKLFCNGSSSGWGEETDCYEYVSYGCNSMNSCADYEFECPPKPTTRCFPGTVFPGGWQVIGW